MAYRKKSKEITSLKALTYNPKESTLNLSTFAFPSNKKDLFFCKDIPVEMGLLQEHEPPSPFLYSIIRNKMISFNNRFDLIVYYLPSFNVMNISALMSASRKVFNPICFYNENDDSVYLFFGNVFILPIDKKTRKTVCFSDSKDKDIYEEVKKRMLKSSDMLNSGKRKVYLQNNVPMRNGSDTVKQFRKNMAILSDTLSEHGYLSYGAFPISPKSRAYCHDDMLTNACADMKQSLDSVAYIPEFRSLIPKSMKEIRAIRKRRYHRKYYSNRILRILRENQTAQQSLIRGMVILARLCGVRFDLLENNYSLCKDTILSEDMIYYFIISLKKKLEIFEGQINDSTFDSLSEYMTKADIFAKKLDESFMTYQNYVLAISCGIPRLKYIFDKRMDEVKREIFEEEVRKDKERNKNLWRNCCITKKGTCSS